MDSFDQWFSGERLRLLRFATALCADAGTAQDVVQEVAFRAYGRWSQLQELDRPDAYLRRMVVNEYLSWRRRWSRIVPTATLPDASQLRDAIESLAERNDLVAGLRRLTPRQRAVVVMRYYQGLTTVDIADVLGCPSGTVRSLLTRSLTRLRVELSEPPPPGDDQPQSTPVFTRTGTDS